MSGSVEDYYANVLTPWGKMFYDIVLHQINVQNSLCIDILDFGSGFGKTADYYAKNHNITAVEPDAEMIGKRFKDNNYNQIHGGLSSLSEFNAGSFDLVICHNVLEYVKNKKEIFDELCRLVKPGGRLSIVKHNELGRVMQTAVFSANPKKALEILNGSIKAESVYFGDIGTYDNNDAVEWAWGKGMELENVFGVRSFYALTQDNEIKFTQEWYDAMLELEIKSAGMDAFNKAAFFNHLIFKK